MSSKRAVFQQIIADFIEEPLLDVVPRDLDIPLDLPKIISLMGPRRSGKTHLLYTLIRKLRNTLPANRLVYINFEDDRLFPLHLEDMDALVRGYYEMFPENKGRRVYFFLDEVQEVSNWEKFVRRLFDQEDCRLFITGSSSKLLSRELASSLRGRTLPFEVFPLSFQEFLRFQHIEVNPQTSKGEATLLNALRHYLRQGGFPELMFLPESMHRPVINEYMNLMLYRDLTERFSLRNPHLIKYLLKYLLNNISNLLSVHKVFNDLKSQGYRVAKSTIYDYISYLEEAFIVFRIDLWSHSIHRQTVNPSKVYAIDPAFKYATSISEDIGRVFENIVFLELRRRGEEPYYYLSHDRKEVDFYLEPTQNWPEGRLINACFDYSVENTRKRELNGLLQAMKELDLKESLLLTWNDHTEWSIEGKTVVVRPLWKFLLGIEG